MSAGKLAWSSLLIAAITFLWTSPANAGTAITNGTCPVTIATSGDYSLGTDVGPCASGVDGIDIVASNVTLHLNGHTISGAPSGNCNNSYGIHVMGTSSVPLSLVNVLGSGTISNFVFGFWADYSAGSFVKSTTVTAPLCPSGDFTFGFVIYSTSSQWMLQGNVVNEPGINSLGILLDGNANNTIVRNSVNDSLELYDSSNNTIVNNNASNNYGGIFVLGGSNNEIHANTANNNVGSPGILLTSDANGNFTTGNRISGNKSTGNSPYDMEDDSPNCGSDKWEGNKFNTANVSCIH